MKRLFTLCGAALALLLCLAVPPARAATYVVSNLDDSGAGSLRDAVTRANATAADDTITFSVSGTIVLRSALPECNLNGASGAFVIDGTGQSITISGNGAVTVLFCNVGDIAYTLKALSVVNGRSTGSKAVIEIAGSLSLSSFVFSGNQSTGQTNTLRVGSNRFEALTIGNSRFVGNSANNHPVFNTSAKITITDSSFESNVGNLSVWTAYGFNLLKVTGSTFSRNAATGSSLGGGVIHTIMPAYISNSTFHANSTDGQGGAIRFDGTQPAVVVNSTFSENSAVAGGAAIARVRTGTVTLRNTIVANNTGSNTTVGNCSGVIVDGGGNLSDDMSCGFTQASSLNGSAAQLGPLADNGGPTKTIAPLTGSPAIDQGVNALAVDEAGNALATDQRGSGFARISPSGGTVDRGAVEVPAVPLPVLTTCPAATAQVGVAYNSALGATGGTAPNSFSVTGSLPSGLTLIPSSGTLSGMPIKPGVYAFTARVTDAASPTPRSSNRACSITVAEAANVGPLIVTPTRLSFGAVPAPATLLKQVVTLRNIGPTSVPGVKSGWVPVTIGPVSVTPDAGTAANAFTVVNTCPASLGVGQSCTIVVVAAASPAGPRSATLNIPNNAPASPQTVALSASAAP